MTILVFLGDNKSAVGLVLSDSLTYLFGEYYRPIFLIYGALALGIVIGKLTWNSARVVGLLVYSISITSLIAAATPYGSHGILDFSAILTNWFGKSPMILAFVGGLLISLYLTLRISYRKVFAAVHSKLPSVGSMRGTMGTIKEELSAGKADSK